jgi:hypothetical protein
LLQVTTEKSVKKTLFPWIKSQLCKSLEIILVFSVLICAVKPELRSVTFEVSMPFKNFAVFLMGLVWEWAGEAGGGGERGSWGFLTWTSSRQDLSVMLNS